MNLPKLERTVSAKCPVDDENKVIPSLGALSLKS